MSLCSLSGAGASGFYPTPPPNYTNGERSLGRFPAPGDGSPAPASDPSAILRAGSISRTRSAQLQITTDEGDTVTITRSSTFEAMVGSLRYQDSGPEGAYRQRARFEQTSRSSDFTIRVEGDLSKQELKDIHRLLAQLRPAFRSASMRAGTAAALRVDGSKLDSLAGFELSLTRSVTRNYLELQGSPPPTDPPADPGADPGADSPAPARTPVDAPLPLSAR